MKTPQPSQEAWKQPLVDLAASRVALVCIGRPDSGDDGAAPLLASLLAGGTSLYVFDAQTTPENFVGPISRVQPEVVLLADAVHFHGVPGEIRLIDTDSLDETDFTTHALSPGVFLAFLTERTGAHAMILAIQPERSGPGVSMSEPVKTAVIEVANLLKTIFLA